MHPWEGVISKEDEARYATAGFGRPSGMGTRPALLIIDVQYRTVGTTPKPFEEAITEFATSCGEIGWRAVEHIQPLLAQFRRNGWPVLYPHVAPKRKSEGGRLAAKIPEIMNIAEKGYEFVEEIAPQENDVLLPKKHPSAFFGTPLLSHLIDLGVDTLIVTGCSTSGCVRSTVVDAFSYNFRVVVPEDCVFDRSHTSHAVNLFDMHSKYADVAPVVQVIENLKTLEKA